MNSDWLQLRLAMADAPGGVAFIIDFVNGSEQPQTLQFGGNAGQAALRGLKIQRDDWVVEPVEYELINRKPGSIPTIPLPAGQAYRFTLNGQWDKRVVRFGSTGYLLNPGFYVVAFHYARAVSNQLAWIVK